MSIGRLQGRRVDGLARSDSPGAPRVTAGPGRSRRARGGRPPGGNEARRRGIEPRYGHVAAEERSITERAGHARPAAGPHADERRLIEALRRGDEAAFVDLTRRYTASMTRVSLLYVSSRAVAEEVVQDAWLNVIRGLGRFEGRSSLRTWIFTILANCARRRAEREGRTVPFSHLAAEEGAEESGPARDPFSPPDHPRWSRVWTSPNDAWDTLPEERILGRECLAVVGDAIAALPPTLREVMTLRDVAGWSSAEVAAALGITEANQRVRLHRARARVRAAVEGYLAPAKAPPP